jgi:hypothetical protein
MSDKHNSENATGHRQAAVEVALDAMAIGATGYGQ